MSTQRSRLTVPQGGRHSTAKEQKQESKKGSRKNRGAATVDTETLVRSRNKHAHVLSISVKRTLKRQHFPSVNTTELSAAPENRIRPRTSSAVLVCEEHERGGTRAQHAHTASEKSLALSKPDSRAQSDKNRVGALPKDGRVEGVTRDT